MCALLVGLPDVRVVGVGEWPQWLRIVIAIDGERPSCCGRPAHRHGVREVVLVDLPVFGRPARLVWRKQRWRCPTCRRSLDRAGPADRVGALRVDDPGRRGGRRCRSAATAARSSEVAHDLSSDWHTVMDAVVAVRAAVDR